MVSAIIVAAGRGIRMNAAVRKQYMMLAARPVLSHTLLAFNACDSVSDIILVIPEEDFDFCSNTVISSLRFSKPVFMAAGGAVRQESVYSGLLQVRHRDIVLIHDGVRPFVRSDQILSCVREARISKACILAIPAFDTLKQVNPSGQIVSTLPREQHWLAQTPQAFQYDLIRHAHEKAIQDRYVGTDDASLVERLGIPVAVATGSRNNIKITTPEDLILAEAILRSAQRYI